MQLILISIYLNFAWNQCPDQTLPCSRTAFESWLQSRPSACWTGTNAWHTCARLWAFRLSCTALMLKVKNFI